MNMRQAKRLYRVAVDPGATDIEGKHWWDEVRIEMGKIIAARSDRVAARMIDWWGCWDRKLTALSVARKIRVTWSEMQAKQ